MASGDVLADRYELQDLVTERLGSVTWRANDSILNRNVGIEMLPSSDPRADHFIEAARLSTTVTDPRFLRVLDLIEDDHGQHLVVREWARAFPLDQLLAQSPLPSSRANRVMTEVAEAVANAHERGVYHRRLTPHHVLLKQSGAVRVVGLGVASALAPAGHQDTIDDLQAYEQLDVESLGKLLYACLVSRWPGRPHRPAAGRTHRARPAAASTTGPGRSVTRARRRLRPHPRRPAGPPSSPSDLGPRHRPGAAPDRRRHDPRPAGSLASPPTSCGSTLSSSPKVHRPGSRRRADGPRRTSRRPPRRSSAARPGPSTPSRATVATCSRVWPSSFFSRRFSASW